MNTCTYNSLTKSTGTVLVEELKAMVVLTQFLAAYTVESQHPADPLPQTPHYGSGLRGGLALLYSLTVYMMGRAFVE